MMCTHEWKPIPSWYGRYRCALCGALGYRGIVSAGIAEDENEQKKVSILPYKCDRAKCTRPAVQKRKRCPETGRPKNLQRCAEHKVMA